MALVAMKYYGNNNPVMFHESKLLLNITIGSINTVVLLTSGFFMAYAVQLIKENNNQKSAKFILLAILFGFIFLVFKAFEYANKIEHGLTLDHNIFFTFYWLLTGFHVIHVLVGIVILSSMYMSITNKNINVNMEDIEAGAAFWHLCDLIWLLLFPVIYLLF
jgi:nitric oxide reductase NorE protein